MAVKSNRFIPVLAIAAIAIVGTIFMMNRNPSPASEPMKAVPLPKTAGADEDTPAETLATVVASNRELRQWAERVLRENEELRRQLKLGGIPSQAVSAEPTAATGAPDQPAPPRQAKAGGAANSPVDVIANAWGNATDTLGSLGRHPAAPVDGAVAQDMPADGAAGAVGYKVVPPMGYVAQTQSNQGMTTTRYVRSPGSATAAAAAAAGAGGSTGTGSATRAAQAASEKPEAEPYFTLPENSTLTGVTAMTSLIGRVPVNGRVTDPMQFKAIVGRENLAANGWELPEDLAGMVVTGVAIGDMALSCTEGKVRSMTFVFNDGTIRTISARRSGSSTNGGIGSGNTSDLGFISDLHGNPCIQGKFVTNAPAYLTDIVGAKGLGVAAEALAQAQTTTLNRGDSTSSAVTGNAGSFALGRMGSGAADELTRWLTERLKSSFDAVVTPAGQQLVVHLDTEVAIDKPANARKILHRTQSSNVLSGARYGLE
ncbi:TIGR03752 family integrating conjugative element protein [Paracidovorax citrulli]|uniref:TIGR03752 family integrating conjugative element protein n=1 Tax=Paracidovorax citrulli TaxID=80869 RepID=UPI00255CA4A1|nr:TIGR03752 family integrating conjugative element protein [Paracidovorax citrulli]WIY36616.1 TIGR03752 family integrating conjugative element protein [Paracidovorax citrulli]